MTWQVVMYAHDTMADWEIGFLTPLLHGPPAQAAGISVSVLSAVGRAVTTLGGLHVLANGDLADLQPTSTTMLVLPGGDWAPPHAEAIAAAQTTIAAGGWVAGICGATAGLARSGLLHDRRYTSNGPEWLASVGENPQGTYVAQPVVTDDRVITAGGMHAVDFAEAVATPLGLANHPLLARLMQHYRADSPATDDCG